jgi:HlyD family secretion protein
MNGPKFFMFLGIVLVIALGVYLATTPRGGDIPLTGIVDGTEVIISPQIAGRMVKLTVDEGSEIKKGQLIAELDRAQLAAQVASDDASINSVEAKINEEQHTLDWTDGQTTAAINQAHAMLTSIQADLDEAQANLHRDELNTARTIGLYEGGVASAQDRDTADATLKASRAHVKSLENQVRAQHASLELVEANRRQLDVLRSEIASLQAQRAQAKADRDGAATQLGYTEIYSPIDGVVSVRVARQGEVVLQGSPIVVIVDVNHLWVQADVEEGMIDRIRFGDRLRIQLPSGNIILGTVFFKGVENDFATQRDVSRTKRDIKTFAIKVSIPNSGRRLFTGMTATVLLPRSSPSRRWFSWGHASPS